MADAHHVGLLSQTLNPSPTIRWILPARVRTKARNDVVFVGQNFVQLRELMPDGRLADVTARVELGAQILSAKVISAKREQIQVLDQIIHQVRDYEKFMIGDREISDDQPAQLVVLSIASNEIVFLFAEDVGPGKTRFVYAKKHVIRDVSLSERYGTHIAVDPQSRAMAVAPSLGFCGIFELKGIDEIQAEIFQSESNLSHVFKPTSQDRFVQIDGLILKMDFLPSIEADPKKLMLLLLVAQGGHTSLLIYRWDVRQGPKYAKPMQCSGQRLPLEDSLPLLLIPSARKAQFTIVTETHMVVYDDVTTSEAQRVCHPIKATVPPKYESSSIPPLYVQWAKPVRHTPHLETRDDVYLCREDGQLHYCMVSPGSLPKIYADWSPGDLKVSVDSAFAIPPAPVELGADVFLVGGDQTDGGVFHCKARGSPHRVQTFPNLAPMRDILITQPHENFGTTQSGHSQNCHRIFTCSGKESRFSFINEIRFGLEAKVGWQIPHPDLSSATRMWILEDRVPGKVLFLMSHPLQSTMISFDPSTEGFDYGDVNSHPGVDFDLPTLAAACTPEGIMIQITQVSTNISGLFFDTEPTSITHDTGACVAATTHSTSGHFVVACKTDQGFELKLGALTTNGPKHEVVFGRSSFGVALEPTSLSLIKLGQLLVLIVGTSQGSLELFYPDAAGDLQHFRSYRIQPSTSDIETSSISSLGVLSRSNASQALVLCGLRTGSLVVLAVQLLPHPGTPELAITFLDELNLGSTTVTVTEEQLTTSNFQAALLLCESGIRRLYLVDDFGLQYNTSPIWLTDFANLSSSQPVINATYRVIDHSTADINGLLVCASGNELLIASLVLQDQAVPRRFKLSGPPSRLSYSTYLKKLVVALNTIKMLPRAIGTKRTMQRSVLPSLALVNPDESDTSGVAKDAGATLVVGADGDRIRAILNWRPSDGSSHYELILIGLDADAPDHRSPSGRLLYANVGNVGRVPFQQIRVQTVSKFSGQPVFSLQAYGMSSLLVGAGNEIILLSFDMSTRKFSQLSSFTLPSAATSLSVSGNLVYASSMHHSLLVLKLTGNNLTLRAADTVAKNTKSAVIVEDHFNLTSTTSTGGTTLVAFSKAITEQPPEIQILFEARLPLILEGIKQNYVGSPDGEARKTFEGITLDGTLYRFKTLSHQEWQLLKFLENFLRDDAYTQKMLALERTRPEPHEMHIRGDLLTLLTEPGPCSLRNILVRGRNAYVQNSPNKTEDGRQRGLQFRELAVPVIGELDDLIAGVLRWLRELLRIS